ncbi:MAG: hypothetical protein AB1742_11800 [bacterium]
MKPKTAVFAACSALFLLAAGAMPGCGGGGGKGAAMTVPSPVSPVLPAGGSKTTYRVANRTVYSPSIYKWTLFDATAGEDWVSAVGTEPGLTASIAFPFKEAAVMFIPKDTYPDEGTVNFYIDGQMVGSIDLSQTTPYDTYEEDYVSYYTVSTGLTDTTHTLTIEIATGTVAFDGWRLTHGNAIYLVDCSDANTAETDTIAEVNKIRDGVEGFYSEYGKYPDPGTTDLVSYLTASSTYFVEDPKNAFTGDPIAATSTFSAGDYYYTYKSDSDYELKAYGGLGTLYTVTPNSATTSALSIAVTSPTNHYTTASAAITITGTATADANVTISNGYDGYASFPSGGSFTKEIALTEGVNSITITVSDTKGNSINLVRTVTKDTTSPTIILIEPFPLLGPAGAQYANVNQTPFEVKGYAEPGASSVTVNGTAVTQDALGVFTYSISLVQGNNTVTITAVDAMGNTATTTYTLVYSP